MKSLIRHSSSLKSLVFRSPLQKLSYRCATTHFSHVEQGPPDPILGVAEAFRACTDSNKINVSVGAYRDDNGKPVVLSSVQEAERRVLADPSYNHEYAPIGGLPQLALQSQQLAFGEDDTDLDRIITLQSLSGTGCLRTLAGFLKEHWPGSNLPRFFVPNPTWGNHLQIFNHAGFKTEYYRYYNPEGCNLDFNGMMDDLKNKVTSNDVILFHATAHNPTGVDPTTEQWDEIIDCLNKQGNLVIFDMAYQGFASGDCERDSYSLRQYKKTGNTFMVAQSFAKNFGLYGQRAGAASIICKDKEERGRVESQFKRIARAIYSNPPVHGGRIVSTILGDPQLKKQWLGDVKQMADRIISMRQLLRQNIEKAGSSRSWQHVTDQIGMFTFTGLDPDQCDRLTNEYKIFLTRNGRISMAGVNSGNVETIANAIHQVTK